MDGGAAVGKWKIAIARDIGATLGEDREIRNNSWFGVAPF
jgi:hypothetical protein